MINDIHVGESLGTSDHSIIRFNLACKKVVTNNREVIPDHSKGNYTKLREMLRHIDWSEIFQGKTAYEMWDLFKNIIIKLESDCIPFKQRRNANNHKPLWWSHTIQCKLKDKKHKYDKYKKYSTI